MRTTRTSSLPALLSLFTIALLCATTPTHADDGAFEGVVVEDGVKVRAGAGRTFYIVGSLKKGEKIQVDEVIFGWNKIAAPNGVFSYISKAFVDAQGTGKTGTVNRNDAPVNAASLEGPGDSYRHQLDLAKGDKVTIIGEEGSFYKVIPPSLAGKKTAFVYLPPGSVQKAQIAVPAPVPPTPVVTPPTPTPTPVITPTTTPEVKVDTPEVKIDTPEVKVDTPEVKVDTPEVKVDTPEAKINAPDIKADLPDTKVDVTPVVTPVTPVVTQKDDTTAVPTVTTVPDTTTPKVTVPSPAALQTFKFENKELQAIEAKMSAALKLPLSEQPIDALMAAYHTYLGDASLSANDEYFLQARVIQLKRNKDLASTLLALKQARQGVTPDPDITLPEKSSSTANGASANYDATGQLLTSGVYDGINLPRLLRLVDPTTKRTIAYIRPSGKFNAERSLGHMVGIQGLTRLDRGMNLRIIDVKGLVVLEPANTNTTQSSADASQSNE